MYCARGVIVCAANAESAAAADAVPKRDGQAALRQRQAVWKNPLPSELSHKGKSLCRSSLSLMLSVVFSWSSTLLHPLTCPEFLHPPPLNPPPPLPHLPFPFCPSPQLPLLHLDRLIGLVVKASASRAEDPGFESRLHRDFSGVESYQWLKNWHPTLPGAWRCSVSAGTGWPGVSML